MVHVPAEKNTNKTRSVHGTDPAKLCARCCNPSNFSRAVVPENIWLKALTGICRSILWHNSDQKVYSVWFKVCNVLSKENNEECCTSSNCLGLGSYKLWSRTVWHSLFTAELSELSLNCSFCFTVLLQPSDSLRHLSTTQNHQLKKNDSNNWTTTSTKSIQILPKSISTEKWRVQIEELRSAKNKSIGNTDPNCVWCCPSSHRGITGCVDEPKSGAPMLMLWFSCM